MLRFVPLSVLDDDIVLTARFVVRIEYLQGLYFISHQAMYDVFLLRTLFSGDKLFSQFLPFFLVCV